MSVAARVSQEMGVKLGNEVRRSEGGHPCDIDPSLSLSVDRSGTAFVSRTARRRGRW